MFEMTSDHYSFSPMDICETISPVEQLHWKKTYTRSQEWDIMEKQFLKAIAEKDTKTLENFLKIDSRFCQCESCDKYFLRPSPTADTYICPECHQKAREDMASELEPGHYRCKWCGKHYTLSQYWCSRCYCSVDCREKFNKSELRNESVQRRETLLKNLKKGIV